MISYEMETAITFDLGNDFNSALEGTIELPGEMGSHVTATAT